MSAKFPRGGGGAGPFLARSLTVLSLTGLETSKIEFLAKYKIGFVYERHAKCAALFK